MKVKDLIRLLASLDDLEQEVAIRGEGAEATSVTGMVGGVHTKIEPNDEGEEVEIDEERIILLAE